MGEELNIIVYLPENLLPEDGEVVAAYFPNSQAKMKGNQTHKWDVVIFRKGLSKADRKKLKDSDERKKRYSFGDEEGNNTVPYEWSGLGPQDHWGQDAACWFYLPPVEADQE